ncbi:MAG: TlyA family RNA methyltransferase [Chloroflexi bacterium]|nr:TlyA family RNA methyltransferase [Chloroflexota bacterium]
MPERTRLDQLLVRRGLAPSRERAQALILAGKVRVAGSRADRAAMPVGPDISLEVQEPQPYVSRGGSKLAAVLDKLGIDPAGTVALDIGSSTGGFTDVLLQRGARRVYAVDVGKGQLDWKLRNDERVVVMEGVNAREGFDLPEAVYLIVADVSFISVRLAVPPSFRHLTEGGDAVVLVKPQFEAGREHIGKGGVARDPIVRRDVALAVARRFGEHGLAPLRIVPSPILGREGNVEVFVHCRKGARPTDEARLRHEAEEAARGEVEIGSA